MNMNLFLKEMKRNSVSLISWLIVIIVLISITMAVYPTFMANQSKIMALMTIVPKGALQFKGISNFTDLLSPVGFYAANNVIYMMVLGSIYSIILASNIILSEEYNKTAEYLLTWPVSRNEIFINKTAVILLNILLLNLTACAAGLIWLELVKTGPLNFVAFMILSLYTLLLNFFFGAAGLLISTLIKKAKPITTFSVGLVLILYFIETISKITDGISGIGYLSPFRYARIDAVSPDYGLDTLNLLYFIGLSLLFGVLAWSIYKRKDIFL